MLILQHVQDPLPDVKQPLPLLRTFAFPSLSLSIRKLLTVCWSKVAPVRFSMATWGRWVFKEFPILPFAEIHISKGNLPLLLFF